MASPMIAVPRVVMITGASAGIGRALALRFGRAGYAIGLIAREENSLREVERELRALGCAAACETADVSDAEALSAATARLELALGPMDIWINDAMETVFSRLIDMSADEFKRVTEVTYLGAVHGVMIALKSMRSRGRGQIIQMGSALAYRGIPLQSAYCGAKHAIKGFTEAVRTELIAEGSAIAIKIVDLPAVNTPQFDWARVHMPRSPRPMGRPIEPELVAEAVFSAAGKPYREYWLGLPTALTILGNAILPSLMDYYLALTGISGQQTRTPISEAREDNLDKPISHLHRTRGRFSDEATGRTPLIPGELARIGTVAAGALLFYWAGKLAPTRRSHRRPG
jgi:short-subunit dehydrogenase